MPRITRRDWLHQSAQAAAIIGLAPLWHRPRTRRSYLELALRSARWIERSRQRTAAGAAWPADPNKPDSVGLDFYNGMPGVVFFFAGLYHATGDLSWRAAAQSGADHLIAAMDAEPDQLDTGLYTGIAGLAFTLNCLDQIGAGNRYADAARRAVGLLRQRAKTGGDGAGWNDSNDIISGNAGLGLLLLDCHRRWRDPSVLDLARAAGTRLIATAVRAPEGGLMWYPGGDIKRNLPNFSHGTAGVGYFLATLHERTGQPEFLDAALQGAAYLDAIATRRGEATVIRHHDGDGADLFYLSWCHGPVGTARLFYRLYRITRDDRWLAWVHSLTRGVLESGIPENRTPGFWNNISQCCGNVGVGQYCIDLARTFGDAHGREFVRRVIDDTLRRATDDAAGLRWVQAENRVQPENLVAQTGFMQGAAGVGTFLLQLDALERGKRWGLPLPDTPFAS